jgi:hypothetical protein
VGLSGGRLSEETAGGSGAGGARLNQCNQRMSACIQLDPTAFINPVQ